jgi:hypothetical protein
MSAISLRPTSSDTAQVSSSQTICELVKSSKEKKILRSFELLSKKVELFYHQFRSKEIKFQELYFFCYSEFFDQISFLNLMDSFQDLAGAFFTKVREKLKRDLHSFKQLQSDQGGISDILKKELFIYEKIFSQISDEIHPWQLDFIESAVRDSPFYSSIDGALKNKLDVALAHLTTFCCNWDERVKQILTLDELKRKSYLSQRKIEKHQDVDLNCKLIELFQRHFQEIKDGPIRLLDFTLCMDPAKELLKELEGAVCISEGYFLAELLLLINIYRTKTSFERVYLVDQIKGLEFLSFFFKERVGKENIYFEDLSLERRCAHMRSSFLLKHTLVCSRIFPESFIQYPSSISPLTPKKFFRLTSYFESFSETLKESDPLVKKEKVDISYKDLAAFKENELNLTKKTISILDSILKEMDLAKSQDSPASQIEIEKIKDLFSKAEMSAQVVILDPFDHLAQRIKKLSI